MPVLQTSSRTNAGMAMLKSWTILPRAIKRRLIVGDTVMGSHGRPVRTLQYLTVRRPTIAIESLPCLSTWLPWQHAEWRARFFATFEWAVKQKAAWLTCTFKW